MCSMYVFRCHSNACRVSTVNTNSVITSDKSITSIQNSRGIHMELLNVWKCLFQPWHSKSQRFLFCLSFPTWLCFFSTRWDSHYLASTRQKTGGGEGHSVTQESGDILQDLRAVVWGSSAANLSENHKHSCKNTTQKVPQVNKEQGEHLMMYKSHCAGCSMGVPSPTSLPG